MGSMLRPEMNLLVALDALLSEKSVTKAAAKLGLTQPALSASLARLRRHFNDQLLVRDGNSYRLTPLAARLADPTANALDAARKVFASEAVFDPSTSTREFQIYGSDYAFAAIGSRVSTAVREIAPSVRFRFMQHTPAIVEDRLDTLRTVDGILLPHGFTSGLSGIDVFEDNWLCVVAKDNEAVGEQLTIANLRELPWVFTYQSRSAFTPAARQLQMSGIDPHVDVVVEGFLALPYFIAGTERIGFIQAALADRVTALGDLRLIEPPFDIVPLRDALWWHPAHDEDPGHHWMREQFRLHGNVADEAAAS
ncbi:DNA-binding transcriptional LysR family regulator [Sinomonas atrocyanea]|uniref:LysR family transcriptional regulator n=1 Tax=Sinomonas atrocyanea TaxID=37927 RepID=UPI00277D2C47|nr:LysR family transcriptional regulator [Sinomonas atrocyanea]MDP9884562.1 DNA-binding transcriptional LysR family regulator [Sinomonas atrocyanea]